MYDLDSLIDRDPRIRSLDGMDVKRLISILGRSIEVVGVEHLVTCLLDGTSMGDDGIIRTYVGFEPSGRAHIGWKVLADQISSMLEGGANVLIFMAGLAGGGECWMIVTTEAGASTDRTSIVARLACMMLLTLALRTLRSPLSQLMTAGIGT